MIVVDPYNVTILQPFTENLSEDSVYFPVALPMFFLENEFAWMVVQKWPQYCVYAWLVQRRSIATRKQRKMVDYLLENPL